MSSGQPSNLVILSGDQTLSVGITAASTLELFSLTMVTVSSASNVSVQLSSMMFRDVALSMWLVRKGMKT